MNTQKKTLFFLVLLFLLTWEIFPTTVESRLRGEMRLVDDLYVKFATSGFQDGTIKQRLLYRLPELVKGLKRHPLFSTTFASRYEKMLQQLQNLGKSKGTGTSIPPPIPSGAGTPTASTGQPTVVHPAPTLTVETRDVTGKLLQGVASRIKLYQNGNVWKEADGPSHTFSPIPPGAYWAEITADGYPPTRSPRIRYQGSQQNWQQKLVISLPMKLKVYIRELGKVDLIPGAYASMDDGPFRFCPTGTGTFPIYRPGTYEFRAKAIAHGEVIKRHKITQLEAGSELFFDLFPAPTLMVEVRDSANRLLHNAGIKISLFKDNTPVKQVDGPFHLFTELDTGCTYHARADAPGLPPKDSRKIRSPGNLLAWHEVLVIQY